MILLLYFAAIAIVLWVRRRKSPALILLGIYIVSLVCGIPLGLDAELSTMSDVLNLAFVAVMLTLMILPWSAYPFKVELAPANERRVERLTWGLIAVHTVSFVVFSTTLYLAVTTITDYSAFKNGDDSLAFYASLPINHTVLLLAIYLNATAAFLIPLHFYYLAKGRDRLAMLLLLLSFNVVLEGITTFSRAGLVYYFALYVGYLPLFLHRLGRRQRRLLATVGVFGAAVFGTAFYQITNNRFADYLLGGEAAYSNSSVTNPFVYSVLDYASQWYANSGAVLRQYSFQNLHGELSFPLGTMVADKLGVVSEPPDAIVSKLQVLWGDRYDRFVGIIANLVFDFGYAGTIIFVLIYGFVVQRIRPVRGSMSIATLMVIGPLFALPAMGTENAIMKVVEYNLLLIYSLAVYLYLYRRPAIADTIGMDAAEPRALTPAGDGFV